MYATSVYVMERMDDRLYHFHAEGVLIYLFMCMETRAVDFYHIIVRHVSLFVVHHQPVKHDYSVISLGILNSGYSVLH